MSPPFKFHYRYVNDCSLKAIKYRQVISSCLAGIGEYSERLTTTLMNFFPRNKPKNHIDFEEALIFVLAQHWQG